MTDQELYETMSPQDEPFEVWECDHRYSYLPEDCKHVHVIGMMEGDDGCYFTKCLDCGMEF